MGRLLLAVAFLASTALALDPEGCGCDPAKPENWEARQCGLCRAAEKEPPQPPVFLLKDINPMKPHRWLVLPRAHFDGHAPLGRMSAAERTALWSAAIAKGRELWGDRWGAAFNGDRVRTQCHLHVHVGKLLAGVEGGRAIVVKSAAEIPVPQDGTGLWVHPHGRKLHIHLGETICETVLLR